MFFIFESKRILQIFTKKYRMVEKTKNGYKLKAKVWLVDKNRWNKVNYKIITLYTPVPRAPEFGKYKSVKKVLLLFHCIYKNHHRRVNV